MEVMVVAEMVGVGLGVVLRVDATVGVAMVEEAKEKVGMEVAVTAVVGREAVTAEEGLVEVAMKVAVTEVAVTEVAVTVLGMEVEVMVVAETVGLGVVARVDATVWVAMVEEVKEKVGLDVVGTVVVG